MTHALLYHEDPTLTPEARWLLWKWARRIGLDQAKTCSVRELLKQLGMTLRQGKTTLESLKEEGVIVATKQPNGRGRPCHQYRVAYDLQEQLASLSCPEHPLMRDVERLGEFSRASDCDIPDQVKVCTNPSENSEPNVTTELTLALPKDGDLKEALTTSYSNLLDGQARKARLTLANRWLLMVLLTHADENGAVMGLSQARLQRLTGLSLNRLNNQRCKLRDLGVMIRYHPGYTGRVLGLRLHSIYYLALDHVLIGRPPQPAIQVELLPTPSDHRNTSIVEVIIHALFRAAEVVKDPAQKDVLDRMMAVLPARHHMKPVWEVVHALSDHLAVKLWLRGHVHQAAIQLLNTAWKPLEELEAGPDTPIKGVVDALTLALEKPAMEERTDKRVNSGVKQNKGKALDRDREHRALLVRLLYALAHRLASDLQYILLIWKANNPTETLNFVSMRFELFGAYYKNPQKKTHSTVNYWRLYGYRNAPGQTPGDPEKPVIITFNPSYVPMAIKRRKATAPAPLIKETTDSAVEHRDVLPPPERAEESSENSADEGSALDHAIWRKWS